MYVRLYLSTLFINTILSGASAAWQYKLTDAMHTSSWHPSQAKW